GVLRAGRMPARKIPPAPRTRCKAPGAQAGCAFFAPGFFAQAKKGGSRRHGAKALDLDVGGTGTAGGSRPALRGCRSGPAFAVAVAVDLDPRGPSGAAGAADQT